MRIAALVDLLGEEAARTLAREMSGRRLYISRRTDHIEVVAFVGEEAARALRSNCAGLRIDIPSATAVEKHLARRRAVELLERGHAVRSVTEITGLSRRTVARLLKHEVDTI